MGSPASLLIRAIRSCSSDIMFALFVVLLRRPVSTSCGFDINPDLPVEVDARESPR